MNDCLGVMQDEESIAEAHESIAAEVDLGGNAMRAMWRWTCYKVSLRTVKHPPPHLTMPSSNATFAFLGKHL